MRRHQHLQELLLGCGILSSVLYVGTDLLASWRYHGYSYVGQTVSELSAIGAPTRSMWVTLLVVYDLLLIAFGAGLWRAAGAGRGLRIAGALMIGMALLGFAWPPMHVRGEPTSLTDTLHIVFTAVNGAFMMIAMVAAALAFGARFRAYTIATIAVMLAAGAWTGRLGADIQAGLPTPWIGIVERLIIYGHLAWVIVLAIALLRAQSKIDSGGTSSRSHSSASPPSARRSGTVAGPTAAPHPAGAAGPHT